MEENNGRKPEQTEKEDKLDREQKKLEILSKMVEINAKIAQQQSEANVQKGKPRGGVGFFLALFLGLIGLVIGLLLFEKNKFERETFVNGWFAGFIVGIVLGLFIYFLYYSYLTNLIHTIFN
ncbi:MAG: hypothetical protein IJS68_01130 [Clostridia bacterium]|nr:hypothetical protein [Clostridia bacterium]